MANFFNSIITGEVQGGTTVAQMPNVSCAKIKIRALASNSGNVYIGVAGATKPDGVTDTTSGFELDAGQDTGWLEIDNLNKLYMITDNNGDDVVYIALI